MKNKVKDILKQGNFIAFIVLIASLLFAGFSVGIIITTIRNGLFAQVGPAIIMCILILAFLFCSVYWFVLSLKTLVPYFQSLKALKYGSDDTATICGYSKISQVHNKRLYSLKLRFFDDYGKEVLYKTPYNYTKEQFKQLQAMPMLKIKRYKKSAVIVEELTDKYEFSDLSKKLKIYSISVFAMSWISILLFFGGMVLYIFYMSKLALGMLISGILLLLISTILKAFVINSTDNFVKDELPHVRKVQNKAEKRKRWKEMELKRGQQKDDM